MSSTDEDPTPEDFTDVEAGMIRVVVGDGRRSFCIHKKLACARSPFFEKCVGNENFREGQENLVSLPEDDLEAFGLIINYLYKHPIREPDGDDSEAIAVKAYILADRLGIVSCKNAIIDAIQSTHRLKYMSNSFPNLISSQFVDGLPLWDYYVAQAAFDLIGEGNHSIWKDQEKHEFVDEMAEFFDAGGPFAVRIVAEMIHNNRKSVRDPAHVSGCTYHDHSDGSKCEVRTGLK